MALSWVPLEANPETMNKFMYNLGIPKDWALCDVLGLDPELLGMVPQPVLAIILLYPLNEAQFQAAKIQEPVDSTKDLYYMKQTIRNACGTVALIHALANSTSQIKLDSTSPFSKFLDVTKTMNPLERGTYLENSEDICSVHADTAQEGQTQAPDAEDEINLHFVTFVLSNGTIYELDGRKAGPIAHGSSSPDTFLLDTAKVLRQIMDRDPNNHNFNLLALTGTAN